ncbi:MAG TPA: amidohydrolase [Acidobacteriota bacterium]|nr:amidohydrolase [Acidobacteriota bacterium]
MNNNYLTRFLLILTALALLVVPFVACQPRVEEQADFILHNGTVYTVSDDWKIASAVAIKGNQVLATGSDDEILAFAGPETQKFDLEGKTVVPGLIDAHAHLTGYASSLDQLNLVGTTSAEEIAGMVGAKAAEVGEGNWITGRGWDQNDWPEKSFPSHTILDQAAPENPVALTRIDGHATWANAKALEIAGVTRGTQAPPGGEIILDQRGNPTGILVDAAQGLIRRHVPPSSPERLKELAVQAVNNCLAVGLTGVHDMGGGPAQIEMYKALIEEGRFPFRVYFNLSASLSNLDELLAQGQQNYGDGKFVVRSIKCFADGALGSRGALLLEPYSDRPDSSGLVVNSEEVLTDQATRALRAGFQVSTHAIGDGGNQITLNAYEAALKAVPTEDHRMRIEHAQIIAPDDIPRFAKLGVLPSMQPTHCTSDLPWAIDRVGMERIKGAYAWRTLLNTGVIIPCGSDFPVELIDPRLGLYAAVTRKHPDGTPTEPYYPEQFQEVLTREEALKGFTIWAAYAAFAEDWLGSLEPGKRADLVVFDRDIMKVDPAEILEAAIVMTMVDGQVAYDNK